MPREPDAMTARSISCALAGAALGAVLGLPAPSGANAPAPCASEEMIGVVVAVSGSAQALAPGAEPRPVACDEPLFCEEVVTAPGASLSIGSGDVRGRVGGDSRVALAGSAGAPELFVERGAVRTTDARAAAAAPVRLVTRDLAASAAGADLELVAGTAGARLCAFDGSAAVGAGPHARMLAAGQCFAAAAGEVERIASAQPAALDAPGFCSFEVGLENQLTPGDVAAPLVPFAFPGGEPAGDIPRNPCDDPGSGCRAGRDVPFDDPDPVPGCDVPGVGCGGGD